MILKFHTPAFPLNGFVEAFTYHEGYTAGYEVDRLLPDGGVDFVIDLEKDPKYIYDNISLEPLQKCTGGWISGMRKSFISISAGENSKMLVIRFKIGKAYPFFQVPLSELTDSVIPADYIFRDFPSIREALLEAKSPEEVFQTMESWLFLKLRDYESVHPVVDFAVNKLVYHPTSQTILELCQKTGYSQKYFIQLFKKYVGLTPKYLQRILKFQTVLEEIEQAKSIDWTRLSYECGYYDQPHFINEFRHFSGLNPGDYLMEKGPYKNYIPIQR